MRRTPLYPAHRALGARFVEFAGWEMPVRYRSIVEEHQAVRTRAGLFDVSHMGEIELRGARAGEACQRVTTNDVRRLDDGCAQYSLLCDPHGGVIDDVIVYRLAADHYFLCVNAANRETDLSWIREHRQGAEVTDASEAYAQIALQGPRATAVLSRLTRLDLGSIYAFRFVRGEVAGCRAIVARTGYTGEDGWELYCAPDDAPRLWSAVLEAGGPDEVLPAGLGARDTLRLEAALPLYGHELSRDTHPYEANLGWVVRLDKGEFIGREALRRLSEQSPRRRLCGLRVHDRRSARAGHAVLKDGAQVGTVTSGGHSPTLGYPIALAYLRSDLARPGVRVEVDVRGSEVVAEVVPLPFYRSPSSAPRLQRRAP